MDPLELSVVVCMIAPLYVILWDINRKIGKYDQMCADFYAMRKAHYSHRDERSDD